MNRSPWALAALCLLAGCGQEPLGANRTLVSDRLLVRPKMLPPPPEGLQPSPWKLLLQLALWGWHSRLEAYLKNP